LGDLDDKKQHVHEEGFSDKPTGVIHLGLSFVEKWKILMKE
jgi:hypothetical protein